MTNTDRTLLGRVAESEGVAHESARPAVGTTEPDEPVAVVLAGAGARGAYEAGMLSALLPKLRPRPTIFIGTSAGAINAALFASLAHLPAGQAAEEAVGRWRQINKSMVIKPGIGSIPSFGARYVASLFGLTHAGGALLDTSPLLRTLSTLIDWDQLQKNLADQRLHTVAVVTTEYGSDYIRSKVFYSSGVNAPAPINDDGRALDYQPTLLTPKHVLASAAIPVVFPPVRLGDGTRQAWYMDGGVRLNAPLKPAIALGARGLVVIASDPASSAAPAPAHVSSAPPPQDAVDQILHSVLNSQMVDDLWNLRRTNTLIAAASRPVPSPAGRPYRHIPVLFGGPPTHSTAENTLDRVARQVLKQTTGGVWQPLRNPGLATVNFLLGSGRLSRPDLMSYLLFEPAFLDAAIDLGREHAPRHPAWGP